MTVKELIEKLKEMPGETDVLMRFVEPSGTRAHDVEQVKAVSDSFGRILFVSLEWIY